MTEANWMNRIRINVIKISSPIFSTIQAIGCTSSLGWSFFFLLMKTMDQWNGCVTAVMSLRGVLYRKPFWWVIPKVFNLMCLLNTILTIQKWPWAASRAESSQWRAKEAAHVLDWLFLDAPYKSLIPWHSVTKRNKTRSYVNPSTIFIPKMGFPHTLNGPSM